MLTLFVSQRITKVFNDGRNGISLEPKNIFYTIPTDTKIDESVTKNIFPNVSISSETCHDRVSNSDGINLFMFNLKTVIVKNFEPIIIIKSL